jgi:hypothetical protein
LENIVFSLMAMITGILNEKVLDNSSINGNDNHGDHLSIANGNLSRVIAMLMGNNNVLGNDKDSWW